MRNTTTDKIKAISFILCAVWLSTTVAFFAMITSGGVEEMELEIGPLLSLDGSSATFFVRTILGFGLIMLGLFIWRRQLGFVLALIWSVWWGIILATTMLTPLGWSERIIILVVVALFAASAWLTVLRLKKPLQSTSGNP